MEPVRTPDGLMVPERDRRWVPVSTMAIYEGVCPDTVYQRMLAGRYPASGLDRRGRDTRYCPAVVFGQRVPDAVAAVVADTASVREWQPKERA